VPPSPALPPTSWRTRLTQALLGLWALQLLLLGWHFAPDAVDLARLLAGGPAGSALRREDPFSRWLLALNGLLPPDSAYLFLDHYEAGKEIEARYLLFPRRHVLLAVTTPPTYLFAALQQERPGFILQRDASQPLGPGLTAALAAGLVGPAPSAGPGLLFRTTAVTPRAAFFD
jgi:hypothetical protein